MQEKIKEYEKLMKIAVDKLDFESAIIYRDKIEKLGEKNGR